eukprot:scaffold173114_cov30-Tisochrysis_lutea.AAC.2
MAQRSRNSSPAPASATKGNARASFSQEACSRSLATPIMERLPKGRLSADTNPLILSKWWGQGIEIHADIGLPTTPVARKILAVGRFPTTGGCRITHLCGASLGYGVCGGHKAGLWQDLRQAILPARYLDGACANGGQRVS